LLEATDPTAMNHHPRSLWQFASFQAIDRTRAVRRPSLMEVTEPDINRFQSQQVINKRRSTFATYNNKSSWRLPKKFRNNHGLRNRTMTVMQDKTVL